MPTAKGLHRTDKGNFVLVYTRGSEEVIKEFTEVEIMHAFYQEGLCYRVDNGKMYQLKYSQHSGQQSQPMSYEVELEWSEIIFPKTFINKLAHNSEVRRIQGLTGLPAWIVKMTVEAVTDVVAPIVVEMEIRHGRSKYIKMFSEFSKQLKAI